MKKRNRIITVLSLTVLTLLISVSVVFGFTDYQSSTYAPYGVSDTCWGRAGSGYTYNGLSAITINGRSAVGRYGSIGSSSESSAPYIHYYNAISIGGKTYDIRVYVLQGTSGSLNGIETDFMYFGVTAGTIRTSVKFFRNGVDKTSELSEIIPYCITAFNDVDSKENITFDASHTILQFSYAGGCGSSYFSGSTLYSSYDNQYPGVLGYLSGNMSYYGAYNSGQIGFGIRGIPYRTMTYKTEDSNKGLVNDKSSCAANTDYTFLVNNSVTPTAAKGYKFSYWTCDSTIDKLYNGSSYKSVSAGTHLTTEQVTKMVKSTKSYTFTAHFEEDMRWNYTYDYNYNNKTTVEEHKKGTANTLPSNKNDLFRPGYVFTGWKDETGKMYKAGASVNVDGLTSNLYQNIKTFTAQWEKANVLMTPKESTVGGKFAVSSTNEYNEYIASNSIKNVEYFLLSGSGNVLSSANADLDSTTSGNSTGLVIKNYSATMSVPKDANDSNCIVQMIVTYSNGKAIKIESPIIIKQETSNPRNGIRYIGNGIKPNKDSEWVTNDEYKDLLNESLSKKTPEETVKF